MPVWLLGKDDQGPHGDARIFDNGGAPLTGKNKVCRQETHLAYRASKLFYQHCTIINLVCLGVSESSTGHKRHGDLLHADAETLRRPLAVKLEDPIY